MKICNTVYTVSIMNIHMCHMNKVVFNYVSGFIIYGLADFVVQFTNNWHKLWYRLVHKTKGPFFKCFCKNCMICICTDLWSNIDCLLHQKSFFAQLSNQLWNYHRWMCIVNLDSSIICKIMKVTAFCHCLFYNQFCSITNHEILLVNTKKSSLIIRIIRIKK